MPAVSGCVIGHVSVNVRSQITASPRVDASKGITVDCQLERRWRLLLRVPTITTVRCLWSQCKAS